MNILALEFSSPRRSVAIAAAGVIRGMAAEEGTRETHAFALIEKALAEAQLSREQIECVAVGIGPGSYAGIRIAIAMAQGWQLARSVKLLGISSADAVAAQAHQRGWRGQLHTVIDAQRQEFFSAAYDLSDVGWRLTQPFSLLAPGAEIPGALRVRIDVADSEQSLLPEAAAIATLAGARTEFLSGPELEPIYLRKAEFVKAPAPRINH